MSEFKRHHEYGAARDRYADVVVIEGSHKTLYLSGMTGVIRNESGEFEAPDFDAQCARVYARIKELLAAQGASMADIVKTVAYVKETDRREQYLQHRLDAMDGAPLAAHTYLVVQDFAIPEILVEVDVIAVVPA